MIFRAKDLAQAAPRPQNPPAQPVPSPGPSDDDPNTRENTENPREGDGPPPAMIKARNSEKRHIIREHTFRFDGNVTVSSEYI